MSRESANNVFADTADVQSFDKWKVPIASDTNLIFLVIAGVHLSTELHILG